MPADLSQRPAPPVPLAVGEREAARLLGVSARTLFNWRAAGRGPRFKREGGRILYATAALSRWLDADEPDADGRTAGDNGGGQ